VPWRFSDAGRRSAWIASSCRRPKTCTIAELATSAATPDRCSGTNRLERDDASKKSHRAPVPEAHPKSQQCFHDAFLVGMGTSRQCARESCTNVCLAPCKFGTPGVKRIIDHSLRHAGNRWHVVTVRARSGDDHHRGRGAGAQFDVVWNLLDAHHDW
jgi:hypothetical protein